MNFEQQAIREWAWNAGRYWPENQWILSNRDTWELNPHYTGPEQVHPEDNSWDNLDEPTEFDEWQSFDSDC